MIKLTIHDDEKRKTQSVSVSLYKENKDEELLSDFNGYFEKEK
jgi:hypothetical protein